VYALLTTNPVRTADDLISFRLVEGVKYVTYVPLGTYHATSDFTVATATGNSLSVENRAAMPRAANRANADFTNRRGSEMPAKADPSLVSAIKEFVAGDIETAGKLSQESFGIAEASAQDARFLALVKKWGGIVARMQDEVWGKVDFAN
jgi:hypothetical protein